MTLQTDDSQVASEAACEQAYDELARQGFARLNGLLDANQVKTLRQEAALLLDHSPADWDQFPCYSNGRRWQPILMAGPGRTTNYFDFIGLSPALDSVLDELCANPALQGLLRRVLGADYRVWYAQIRRAEVGARPLRLHQDRPGEVGLAILLNSVPSGRGTTVFVPGSQRWPRVINSFPLLYPRYVERFLRAAVGEPGDMYLFYNATWHGLASTQTEARTAIILTFRPKSQIKDERKPPSRLLEQLGPHLRTVLSRDSEGAEVWETTGVKGSTGPDEVVGERLPPVGLLSPWRLAMAAAAVSAGCVAVFRSLKAVFSGNARVPNDKVP